MASDTIEFEYSPTEDELKLTGTIQQTYDAPSGVATVSVQNWPLGAVGHGGNVGMLQPDNLLHWNNTNKFFGINVSTPSAPLHVVPTGSSPGILYDVASGNVETRWTVGGVTYLRHFLNLANIADQIWAGPDATTGFFQTVTFEEQSGASGAVGMMSIGGKGLLLAGAQGTGSVNGVLEIISKNVLGTSTPQTEHVAIALTGGFDQSISKLNGGLGGGILSLIQGTAGNALDISHTGDQGIGNEIHVKRNGTTVANWDRIGTLNLTTLVNTTSDNPKTLVVTGQAHTHVTAEIVDIDLALNRTVTFTGPGTIAAQRSAYVRAAVYDSLNAGAILTKASTFALSGPPTAGSGNLTITNPWTLDVESGGTRLNGPLTQNGNLSLFGVTPVGQQTGGAATAGATYTATEQGMINRMYAALRAYGALS